MPGTGSAFSGGGAGVCALAGVWAGGAGEAGDDEEVVVAGCWIEGAMACVVGRAAFLLSVLSHEASNSIPTPRRTILRRFTQDSIRSNSLVIIPCSHPR